MSPYPSDQAINTPAVQQRLQDQGFHRFSSLIPQNARDGGQWQGLFLLHNPRSLTLPETNIAPEIRSLEKEIPIGNHHFYGLC